MNTAAVTSTAMEICDMVDGSGPVKGESSPSEPRTSGQNCVGDKQRKGSCNAEGDAAALLSDGKDKVRTKYSQLKGLMSKNY